MNKNIEKYICDLVDNVVDMYNTDKIECNEMYEIFINNTTDYIHKHTDYDCVILEHDDDYNTVLETVENIFFELKDKTIVDFMTTTLNDVLMIVVLVKKGDKNE